ncbi:transmembrane protein 196 isoform X2 [Danio rerio]|uniref:Transmembrane protein 196 n=1 Tax=Danio rerio TaxID=7955 RepID=A0AB32T6S3_DANRE
MCTKRSLVGSLLVLSVFHMGLGVSCVSLGVIGVTQTLWQQKSQHSFSPIWSGACMILFSACCICGLIGGILNVQFVRAMMKRASSLHSFHLAFLCLDSLGILGCTLSTWLTCRLASSEQKRLFLERDLSLHHSVEMGEKVKAVCVASL